MSTLETLKEDLEAKKWREIAEDIIKYQDFKIDIAAERMRGNLSIVTKRNYVINGRYYLKTGEKYNKYFQCPSLLKYIDIVQSEHLQPLVPKQHEQARIVKPKRKDYTGKEARPPITELQVVNNPICAKIEYGVRYNDMIYLAEDEKFARSFLRGIEATGHSAKIVSVELGEV